MQLPSDWPGSGPIDLVVHDLPHRSSTSEWWYLNTHLSDDRGREYSLFAAFFALAIGQDEKTKETKYGYSVEWALVDVEAKRYVYDSVLDRSAPEVGIRRIERGEVIKDQRFGRAIKEIFLKGEVPLPDRLVKKTPEVSWNRLAIDLDGNRLTKQDDGSYRLELQHAAKNVGCNLVFTPKKPMVRHGNDGVVRGSSSEHMFYYFTPSCAVEGTIIDEDRTFKATGRGWYDHEFGKMIDTGRGKLNEDVGWNWASAQLDDGWEFSAYNLYDIATGERLPESGIILIDPDGASRRLEDFEFEATAEWTSTKTFNSYPTKWRLKVPSIALDVTIEAEFPQQEFITIISAPAFWEGRIRITGTHAGHAVAGKGFIERSGFSTVDDLNGFFNAVGQETRNAIHALLPRHVTQKDADRLIGAPGREHWHDGVDLDQYARTVLDPILEIVDRGGKSWRSFGLLACIDAVGGDSEPFRHWLALPELLHVGSLIVDDVQDSSGVRRGGPAAHVAHGTPLAINAGTACYFLAEMPLANQKLPPQVQVDLYRAYFEAVRAAHAGQALDIDGLKKVVLDVVESGDGELLEKRLRATHRLKSAVPPSALARMATQLGGGTVAQMDALGQLFEAFGVAFQIVDDVLNLKGFQKELKNRGEDITEAKVTAPVAKAMSLLDLDARRALWKAIAAKPTEAADIGAIIETLTACGAIDACEKQARQIIEDAWAAVDPLLPDTHTKTRLRAFGWFVLDRHY